MKASSREQPVHYYVRTLLSRTIAGRGDNTGVINHSELYMMYSMTEWYPIHLGPILANLIARQAQHALFGTIFEGPYTSMV